MRLRNSRGYKFIIWSLTLVCICGAGYLGYKTFFPSASPIQQLKASESAYANGIEAYKQKNWNDAVIRFDEARLLSDKALQSLDAQGQQGKISMEEGTKLYGQLMWIKARAIRDHAYAKAQAEGKPIPEIPDPQVGQSYRSFDRIPDTEAQKEAFFALAEASVKFNSDPEVVEDALRVILVRPTIDWRSAEPLLRKAIELNPKDARAHFYLARMEFEQPFGTAATPTQGDKKSIDRVEKAREHLAAAKQAGSLYWRTVGLEATIFYWSVETAVARKLKPNEVATAEKAVDLLLFEPQNGAIAMATRGEKVTGLGMADMMGLKNILAIGMTRAIAEVRKPGGSTDRVRMVADAAMNLTKKIVDDPALAPYQPDAIAALVAVTSSAQAYLSKADPTGWREYVAGVDAVLAKAPDAAKTHPGIRLTLAEIATRDAESAQRTGDPSRAKELLERGIKLAEEGLKIAEDAKLPTAQLDEFHGHIAEWELLSGRRGESIEPHFKQLRESTIPRFKALGQFFEAVLAQQQGRLDKARKLLLPLANDRTNKDIAFKANLKIADLALVTGDPNAALAALREVELVLQKQEDLSTAERAWAAYFIQNPDEIVGRQILATLNIALQIASRHTRDNPGQPLPANLLTPQETSVENLKKKLRTPSGGDRIARLAIVNYLIQTARRDVAEVRLSELATDYPDSIEVLRRRAELLAAPQTSADRPFNPNGVAAADTMIRKYLKDYPADRTARLFYAEWLVRTNRAQKAIDYLKDPMTFPGGRDEAVERLLFNALSRLGQREEANRIINSLAPSPAVDAVMIQAAATREAGEKQLKEALGRYENQGFFRVYDADLRLGEGKYEEALREYASAIEFTQVGSYARTGLLRTLIAYGEADPLKGREAATRLAGELPDESGIYLAAALAALMLEEVGMPDDKWEQVKTMYAAVNKWEAVAMKGGTPRQDTIVGRALFRLLAGDPDAAKREATTGLNQYPKHVPLMLLLGDLYLSAPTDTARAREFYDAVEAENPKNPELPYLDARIKAHSGDWAGAAAVYERLVAEKPQNATAYPMLVGALDAGGQKDAALRWAREWQSKIPTDPSAVREVIRLLTLAGTKAKAIKVADDFIAKSVEDVRKRIVGKVPPLAKSEADKVLADVRANALLLTVSGFYRAKAYTEAEERVQEVLKTHPTANAALISLGDIGVAQKQWDKALAPYLEILKQNPRHFAAGNNAAWILSEYKNNPVAALALVEEIRKGRNGVRPVAPERLPAEFLDTIGEIYVKLNRSEQFLEMRSIFEAAVKRYPTDPRMFLLLAQAQTATGEKSKALENLDAAVRLADTKNGLSEDQNKGVIEAAETVRKRIRG